MRRKEIAEKGGIKVKRGFREMEGERQREDCRRGERKEEKK